MFGDLLHSGTQVLTDVSKTECPVAAPAAVPHPLVRTWKNRQIRNLGAFTRDQVAERGKMTNNRKTGPRPE